MRRLHPPELRRRPLLYRRLYGRRLYHEVELVDQLAQPLPLLQVHLQGDWPGLCIKDGDTAHVTQFAVVANGRYYGGEFEIAEGVSLTSGELEVVLIEKVGLIMRPDIPVRILAKSPLDRAMKSFTSRDVLAESPTDHDTHVPVQIDGEVWGSLPMSFRIQPAAVRVIR